MDDTPQWRVYERVVAAFELDAVSMDVSVIPNASLIGGISGGKHLLTKTSHPMILNE
jgi:hypothetical protein